ncbi:rod binding protein [Buttiauxella sp. JUb87]|uniref:rod-binding protein n=1 Tax=unclassified Buttiauxella TaxID=2634062 RepID=UPI00105BEDDB|nr:MULTISPECIES: rod-binding protein [unclassified Buttiauxella]TDN49812.1 rod binding protein [Buttiauxella sp. JUb87]
MKPVDRPERAYYDLQSLNNIKLENPQEALEQAASLFETHFLKTVLKHMRDATDALASEDSPFSSDTQRFYRELGDEQLAQRLSAQGSFGLAHMLVKQFGQTQPQENTFKPEGNKVALNEKENTSGRAELEEGLKAYASQDNNPHQSSV